MSGKRKLGQFLDNDEKRKRHTERLDEAIREIEHADFVALDLEFSGLFVFSKKQSSVEDYYKYCAESVPKFLAVQLGICAARRSLSDSNEWILSPFNFHLYPSKRTVFLSDSLSLSWLLLQGFDLKRWVQDGYDYRGLRYLSDPDSDPSISELKLVGAQRLIEAIIDAQKPIVVHNGMLDLLHIYEKFISDLPTSLSELCRDLKDFFGGGIYDTKRVAAEGRYHIFRLSDQSRSATSLDSLRYHLLTTYKSKLSFTLNPELEAVKRGEVAGYNLQVEGAHHGGPDRKNSVDDKSHEAGYDALMTAQVFLLQIEWVRRNGEQTRTCRMEDPIVVPFDWEELPFYSKIVNSVEVVGVSPGMLSITAKADSNDDATTPATTTGSMTHRSWQKMGEPTVTPAPSILFSQYPHSGKKPRTA